MRLKALARVKGQTFNQDTVSLVQPCRKGETGCEATDYPKGDWEVVCLSRYLWYRVFLSPFPGHTAFLGSLHPSRQTGSQAQGCGWLFSVTDKSSL